VGWEIPAAALLVPVISCTYVTGGGQTSVIMTDLLQLTRIGSCVPWTHERSPERKTCRAAENENDASPPTRVASTLVQTRARVPGGRPVTS
jgi:hypothetical protein